jgi:hypothetical protein
MVHLARKLRENQLRVSAEDSDSTDKGTVAFDPFVFVLPLSFDMAASEKTGILQL